MITTTQNDSAKGQQLDRKFETHFETQCDSMIDLQSAFGASTLPLAYKPLSKGDSVMPLRIYELVFGLQF